MKKLNENGEGLRNEKETREYRMDRSESCFRSLKACNPRNEYTFRNDIIIFVLKSRKRRKRETRQAEIYNLIFIITYLSVSYPRAG